MNVDFLTITTPIDGRDDAYDNAMSVMSLSGFRQSSEFEWRNDDTGLFRVSNRSGVVIYSASGSALESIRQAGQFDEYLYAFGMGPHRVSKMDIAHDISLDTPPLLQRLWDIAHSADGLSLTRKKITTKNIRQMLAKDLRGVTTGTLYLGSRKSEVHCRVYDKRHERECKTGRVYDLPLTRYELTVTSKIGISLRDVQNPLPVFNHFMGAHMPYPFDCEPWEPAGEGFTLPPRITSLPAERLKRRLEASGELSSLIALADEIGSEGRPLLISSLRRMILAAGTTSLTDNTLESEG